MRNKCLFASVLACLVLAGPLMAAWEPDFRMTNSIPGQEPSSFAARWLAASDGKVHVVWCDSRNASMDVFYKRSTDAGATWEADVNIADNPEWAQQCAVAASGDNVYIAWDGDRDVNEEIYLRASTDGGASWGETQRMTVDDAQSMAPTLACWGSYVYLAWADTRTPDGPTLFYRMSEDNGSTWTAEAPLTDPEIGVGATIAVDDSMVHAAWYDFREGNYRAYYKRSFDHGASWSGDEPLSVAFGMYPSISVSGMDVHAVWTNSENELAYRGSTDGGTTWSPEQQLSIAADASTFGSVYCSGPMVHVVWHEGRYANESELAYRLSQDHGATWGEEIRLTDAWGVSTYPSLGADGDGVHVSWLDARDTINEVYYKRNPDGNVPGVSEGGQVRNAAPALAVVPNPFSGTARVAGHENETFVVFDAAGRATGRTSGARIGDGLAAGVYLLRSADRKLGPVRFVKLQ